MNKKIFAIKDKKSNYLEIFTAPNELVAIRDFSSTCTKPETPLYLYPSDYCLACLGDWNLESGMITACEPKVIAEAEQYAPQPKGSEK